MTIQCGGERHVQQLVDGRLDWEAVKEAFLAEVVELEASGNPPLHRTGDCTGLTRQRFQANEVIKVHVTKKGEHGSTAARPRSCGGRLLGICWSAAVVSTESAQGALKSQEIF